MKILLALDDPSDRLFLSRLLLARGDEAAVAMDGAGLQEQARSGRFAAVIVGETFGGEDACTVVAGLHGRRGTPESVLLVWSPGASPGWQREAMAAGADDTLGERDPEALALRLAVAERTASERTRVHDLRGLAAAFDRAPASPQGTGTARQAFVRRLPSPRRSTRRGPPSRRTSSGLGGSPSAFHGTRSDQGAPRSASGACPSR